MPQSLRGQFALALVVLSLLMLAGGVAAILALRSASDGARQLAQERLVRVQKAQELLQRTLLVERGTNQMLVTESLASLRASHASIVRQLESLDVEVQVLAGVTGDGAALDLHQASQLFRSTANVVAHLREDMLQAQTNFSRVMDIDMARLQASHNPRAPSMAILLYRLQAADHADEVSRLKARFSEDAKGLRDLGEPQAPASVAAAPGEPDPFSLRLKQLQQRDTLERFHKELRLQAEAMVAAARLQSASLDDDYRRAVGELLQTSSRNQRWILALLACSLIFAWLVVHVFLGRHALLRLHFLSRYLRQGRLDNAELKALVKGRDEIADMARAVRLFLEDRQVLQHRTEELSFARERLIEQSRVLEMIASNAPLSVVLDRLTRLIEEQLPGVMCSILLLDEDGVHLRHGAAPSLPADYVKAIDGVRVGPSVGSCGTAIDRGEIVVVADILVDPLWSDFRALATQHGLRSCWSAPVFASNGTALGTFAVYSPLVRTPTAVDLHLVDLATRIAGIAIERKRAQDRIHHMAHYDELTGLPNRNLLADRLDRAMLHAAGHGGCVSVAFIDLDNFKLINDSLGHSAGDDLLKTVAARISQCVRAEDTVVRQGGDEFVIVLQDHAEGSAAVEATLQRIVASIAHPIRLGEREVQIGCSVGVAMYPADGTDTSSLLMNADAAMYRAKDMGRNNLQFYRSEMNASSRERLSLEEALRHAIARGELFLHYQPQVDLRSGLVCGVEALVRWNHPQHGLISPAAFIPMAEESGLIVQIGDWVLRTACMQSVAWQEAGLRPIIMSVNVSARQFRDRHWLDRVRSTLRECGMQPENLELELTESMIMHDVAEAAVTMHHLRAMGVRLAIDDFGTGHSSLSALKSFPIQRLKIDRAFVRDITIDEQDRAIVMAVIELAHRLGLEVIAEGVETDGQLQFLRGNGCDQMQGYLFSRPALAESIPALLAV